MPSFDARRRSIDRLRSETFDFLILGGGINGAGIARDLCLRARRAGSPLAVALVERNQFGWGTSGRNSQLIHGGLRYLKNLEFHLVREALRERALLLKLAPDFVEPLAFLMPFRGLFERVYYGSGLVLYDLLAGKQNVARHRVLGREELAKIEPALDPSFGRAAIFYDCRVNSARFVLANVFDAVANGAAAANYVRAGEPVRENGIWRVELEDTLEGQRFETRARKLIDAQGPWSRAADLRLVRGSHIVVSRLTSGTHALAWFEASGRIVFVIPWGEREPLSLVGTTDVDHEGGPDDVRITRSEVEYLLGVVRMLFPGSDPRPIAAYSALRPLLRDESSSPTKTSREHRIWNSPDGILHVAGGKYTTYRLMSEEAADLACSEMAPALAGDHPTASAPLEASALPAEAGERIAYAVECEMARRLADVMFVSTYWGYEQQWNRERLEPYAREMGRRLGWDERRGAEEIERVLWQSALPEGG